MRIALIAAGAGGMYCGSCLKDNALAAALNARGHEALLIPTYTPLRLDEPDVSRGPVFLGGVNAYLSEKSWYRRLPLIVRRWLDAPMLLGLAGRFVGRTPYRDLGELTLSMLRGVHGRQRDAIAVLANHLAKELKPDVVLLTNLLLSGVASVIRGASSAPVVACLQGDDVFLDGLYPDHRSAAVTQIRANGQFIDGYLATSATYADHMANYIGLPRESIDVAWPGINVNGLADSPPRKSEGEVVIGYFARIDPGKGLDRLVSSFIELRGSGFPVRLRISGYLGPMFRQYLTDQLARCRDAGHGDSVEHVESPSRTDKVRFLRTLDVFCVPARLVEPKALYLLEALAVGVPAVAPRRGVFSEILEATGGGLLVDDDAITAALERLVRDEGLRRQLGQAGRAGVVQNFSADAMAQRTELVLSRYVNRSEKVS